MGACCSDAAGGNYSGGHADNNYMNGDSEVSNIIPSLSGSRGLPSYVQLQLSASNLRVNDCSQKADSMVVAYVKKKDGSWEEIGRTEVVANSLDPVWVTNVERTYSFEENQQLMFRVYHVDFKFSGTPTENLPLSEQVLLGEVECLLAEVITTRQPLTKEIQKPKEQSETDGNSQHLGTLVIKVQETVHSKSLVEIGFHCSELDNKELFSKSDPFLKVSRFTGYGNPLQVYQTEVKANNIHPTWRPMKATLQHLCSGDMDRPLKIECYDFNSSGKHDIVGSVQLSLKELQEMAETCNDVELKRVLDGKVGGKLCVQSFTINTYNTFLDYIFDGYELSFMVGVDFTASNGNPLQQDSLHYIDPSGKLNVYQNVIQAFADIISVYDTSKQFYAWGFGGRPIDGPVSHCFALNGKVATAAEVTGIPGIMHAYSQALRHVALAGPTLFAPVINMAASIASEYLSQEKKRYFVLLIITDGVITDSGPSITALVKASTLPLSVFIVGVGGADFSEMEILDSEKHGMVTPDGQLAVRDIVHFVAMRGDLLNAAALSKALLAELPRQFLAYMDLKSIAPQQNHML
ncbi:hypothetical protein O6H91_11G039500 [Diphasiastrum complanatum]|uniref:Uncharacterized protein n=1 Tax=Diphasiastrum complanatum TaxID=34168 RepID=A0ACC2C9D9_DIPCM|nr:hypothetical protein O6H91_Y506100 [Diphasiastrum complanatum]KAJ7538247.1 hypothetical protein O6H91_11G039500 [Diphasiastrum complanatum]